MVTVGYERARGLRVKHQTASGFSMSCTRTIAAPLPDIYATLSDDARRRTWLGRAKHTVRKANANKNLRITWGDDSDVIIALTAKGPSKTQIAVEHSKLSSADDVTDRKEFWSTRLDRLRSSMEAS
jgi:uncharacterized protein YndB with AHSA1/START domain